MRLISWNVNGVRALQRKGFLELLPTLDADVLCLQETKAWVEQLDDSLLNPPNFQSYWNQAEKKGYSGVAVYTKEKPLEVKKNFGKNILSSEGRIIMTSFKNFKLFNIYFPNGKRGHERVDYKIKFCEILLDYLEKFREKDEKLVLCGDFNTAHKEIDLARPKQNVKTSGFLPEERAALDKFFEHGYIDTFREFQKEGGHYTWWDQKFHARDRNVGWRIDYFFISKNLRKNLKDAFILPNVMGSDHCPVGIELDV